MLASLVKKLSYFLHSFERAGLAQTLLEEGI